MIAPEGITIGGGFIFWFLLFIFNALAFRGNGISLLCWFVVFILAWLGFESDPVGMSLLLFGPIVAAIMIWVVIGLLRDSEQSATNDAHLERVWEERKRQAIRDFYRH